MITAEVKIFGEIKRAQFESGTLLSDILNSVPIAGEGGHSIDLPCGGKGTCRRCRVLAAGELSPPTNAEIAAFGEEGINEGLRLACQSRATGDVVISLYAPERMGQIMAEVAGAKDINDPLYKKAGIAIDIGTTTLAALLYSGGGHGQPFSMKNPQTRYGADVITRIGLARDEGGDGLAAAVREGLGTLMESLVKNKGFAERDVDAFVITGNTAMLYLLNNINPDALSHAPFEADRLFGEYVPAHTLLSGAAADAKVYLPRCISAFVGADITTAILASGLMDHECALLIDIGTNGEIALKHGGGLLCCSTAAGPSFEGAGMESGAYAINGAVDKVWLDGGKLEYTTIGGAKPVGICGSGIIDALATLLAAGVVDETGMFDGEDSVLSERIVDCHGQDALLINDGVYFTAGDVRKVQLAKGSVRAGIETLIGHAGISADDIEALYIAGGFGNYLNLESAAGIGLIPPSMADRTRPIGNAALGGAVMLLNDAGLIGKADDIAKRAVTVDLSTNPVFHENYMQYMMFE